MLLELAKKGVSREQAYEWVQRNAMRSFDEQRDFKALLLADPDVTRVLPPAEIERAFDLDEQFKHVDHIFDRVLSRQSGREGREPHARARLRHAEAVGVRSAGAGRSPTRCTRSATAGVEDVRQGKYFELDLATTEAAQAEALAAEVADKLLANPVIESYRIEVD